jgi:Tol biopolymer transport system component
MRTVPFGRFGRGVIGVLLALPSAGCVAPGAPGFTVLVPPQAQVARQLTFSPSNEFAPAWSPDGRTIAFVSDQTGMWNLWVVDPDGRGARGLTFDGFQYLSPVFTRDSAAIAVASDRGSPTRAWTDLWLIERDGSRERRLISETPSVKEFAPALSRDGRLLGYLDLPMSRPPQYRLLVTELPGGIPRVLTEEGVIFSPIRFSPDGLQVLFSAARSGTAADVWVMGVEGSGARALTMRPATDTAGDWSPDGRTIVFVSDQGGHDELWLMDAQGQNARQLTYDAATASMPAFSPDGARIVYTSTKSGNQDLWIIPVQ